jgi:hypothetical protein
MPIGEIAGAETATIKLGDKEYTLSALTLNDYAAVENDMKEAERKELVKLTEGMGFSPTERVEYIGEKLAKIDIVTAMSSQSKRSIVFLAYHSIKRKHPDIEYDDVASHMTVDKMTEIAGNVSIIMGTSSKKAKGRAKKATRK